MIESRLPNSKTCPIEEELAAYCKKQIVSYVACKYASPEAYSKDTFFWRTKDVRFDEHSVHSKVAFIGLKPSCVPFGHGHFDNTFNAM